MQTSEKKIRAQFIQIPSGKLILREIDYQLYVNRRRGEKGSVYEAVESVETRQERMNLFLDGGPITREAYDAKIATFQRVFGDYLVEWQYPGAAEDLAAFKARVTSEIEDIWTPIAPEEIQILHVPLEYDPRYEEVLWHENFEKAELLRLNTLAFAKDAAHEIFKGMQIEIPEHSGLRFMKVNGNYVGDAEYTRPFVGNLVEIAVQKGSIRAYLRKALLKIKAKEVSIADIDVKELLKRVTIARENLASMGCKRSDSEKRQRLQRNLVDIEDLLYAEIKKASEDK